MGTDFETLVEAENLLRPRLKNVALIVLARYGRPARFVEIGRGITDFTTRHVSDSRLYTAMIQLSKEGHAHKDTAKKNQPLWAITPEGLRHAQKINALAKAIHDLDEAGEGSPHQEGERTANPGIVGGARYADPHSSGPKVGHERTLRDVLPKPRRRTGQ